MESIEARALAADLTSLVVADTTGTILSWHDGSAHPRWPIMSVTKMVVAVATGAVLGDGVVALLDVGLRRWFSEWARDPRGEITLRQLLTHRSGLEAPPPSQVYPLDDVVAAALDAPLSSAPGGGFVYNNLAINLVAETIGRIEGEPFVDLVQARLFAPLDIDEVRWRTDRAGHPYCFADLLLSAPELVRLGGLLLDDGDHGGPQVLPAGWSDQMRPLGDVGLGCFGRYAWIQRGDDGSVSVGPKIGYGHDGDPGQELSVLPDLGAVVAARGDGPSSEQERARSEKLRGIGVPYRRAAPAVTQARRGFATVA